MEARRGMSNVAHLRAGNAIAPIIPTSIEEVARLATGILKSGLSVNGLDTEEKVIVAILHGLEIGLPPMQSIQRIAVINGRPTIFGDALPALLWSRGFKLREWMGGEAGSTRCAFCEITRPDGSKIERAFSETDALKAGLLNKSGPWKQYPDRMLQMRARGFAARDGAADVLSGLYLAEEMQDAEMKDVTPPKAVTLELPDFDEAPPKVDAIDEPPAQSNASVDIDALHATIDMALATCKDAATLAETWNQNEIDVEGLDRSSRQRFYDLYSQHEKRIEAV
jgi:hypothetical protein